MDDDDYFVADLYEPSSVPCPEWCSLPDGHPYDPRFVEDEPLHRAHERRFGIFVDVSASELALTLAGPAELLSDKAEIFVQQVETVTPDEAREMAAELVEAAAFRRTLVDPTAASGDETATGRLHTALSDRQTWMQASGRPQSTIRLRLYHVQRVLYGLDAGPWSVSAHQLIAYLGAKSWAPETRRSYRASLRSFFGWARAAGHRRDNPAELVPAVKVPRGIPRPTPELIYQAAVATADERTALMVQLAAIAGLRRSEIANVRREHVVQEAQGYGLTVKGKGGHERLVPLPDELAHTLLARAEGWIFPSSAGGHLSAHHVGKVVSQLLPEGWTCHTLRHRCATVAYAAERDLRAVQELLGHANVETTRLYTQVPKDAVRRAVEAAARSSAAPKADTPAL